MKDKILVVEDDPSLISGLVDLIGGEGFDVVFAENGKKAMDMFRAEKPDLVLLDIMLPEKSGYDVCRDIRRENASVPVIMLTAKGEEVDKVVGLELGADDYIVKPFGMRELLARIRAALRRSRRQQPRKVTLIEFGDVVVDPKTLKGRKKQKEFDISRKEVDLLQLFIEHDGQVVDRGKILEKVWGTSYWGTTRTLDQYIVRLRQKIEDKPSAPVYITTIHGVGYRFTSRKK